MPIFVIQLTIGGHKSNAKQIVLQTEKVDLKRISAMLTMIFLEEEDA